jgi:glycosidase
MQWDASAQAGFSTAEPWLPLGPDWRTRNVAAQAGDDGSMLALHRRLLALRRAHPALALGSWHALPATGDVLAYERRHGDEAIVVALNLGASPQPVSLPDGALLLSVGGGLSDGMLGADAAVILKR